MLRSKALLLLPLSALALAACGAPEEEAAAPEAATATTTTEDQLFGTWARSVATVYVQHGINGKDLGLPGEALPVDVQVGDACALTGFTFRKIAGPLSLPPGAYDVKVRLAASPPCSGGIAVDAPGVRLAAGDNVTILAHLAESATPTPTASVFENDVTFDFARARVTARHAANFSGVDVGVNGAVAFRDVRNGDQGAAPLRFGPTRITIAPTGTTTYVFDKTLPLRPLTVYFATAVGTPANGTFEVLLQTLPMSRWPDRPARVTVVHGINGKDLGLASETLPVDVKVGDRCLLTGFEFRSIAGPVKLAAGTYDISVRLAADPPCSGPAAITVPGARLDPGADVTVVAHLANATAPTPTATIFGNDVRRTEGKARVTARHTANFSAVDVLVNGGVAFAGVLNGQQGSADLRRGTYNVAIVPAGTGTRVFDADLALKPGRLYTAYAVGTPANGTFEVLLQERKLNRSWAWGWGHD